MIGYSHGCEQHSPEPSRPHSIDSIDKVPIIRPGLATVIWTRRYGRAKAPSLALAAVLVIAWDDAESLETPSLCDAVTTAPLALLDALDDGGCWPCTHTRQ